MTERVQKTLDFLKSKYDGSKYYRSHTADKAYRWEHSLRVAKVGAAIAAAEGLDAEAMTVAGLLHDVYYGYDFSEGYDWAEHGRDGARAARPFVEGLGFPAETAEDILYGIAIHVDDRADFPGRRNAFTMTVGEADNIDRFDVFRIYDNLRWKDFYDMTLDERVEWLEGLLPRLERLRGTEFATGTAARMWREKVDYQMDFHRRLLKQMRDGEALE